MFRLVNVSLLMISIAVTVFFSNRVQAEVNNLHLENLSVEHGLSQGTITSIFQDSEGFMWIGTENGLNLYDGYSFRNLAGPDNDFDRYAVYEIIQTTDKLLWLNVAGKGIYTYSKQTDQYQKILATDPDNEAYYLIDMVEDDQDNVWIASNKTIIFYDKNSQKIARVLDLSTELPTFNRIHQLLYHQDILYIATRVGLFALNVNTMSWKKLPNIIASPLASVEFDNAGANKIFNLHISKENRLYLGTDFGIYSLAVDNIKSYIADDYPLLPYNVIDESISSWRFFPDGKNLYIGSHLGLSVINMENEKTEFLFGFNDAIDNVSSNIVASLIKDQQGVFWLGSNANGIYKWNPKQGNINNFYYKKKQKNSLSDNVVWSITGRKNHPEQLWVGTSNGINLLNSETATVEHYLVLDNPKGIYHSSNVTGLFENEQKQLWISTLKGVKLFDIEKKQLMDIPYDKNIKDVLSLQQYYLYYDRYNTLWSISDKGFNRILLDTGEIDPLTEITEALGEAKVSYVLGFLPNSEKMLFFTQNSLWYFDIATRKSKLLYIHSNIKENDWAFVDSWVIDQQGVFWFGLSGQGLIGLDATTFTKKYIYNKSNSIVDQNVYGLLIDKSGDIWFSSHNGIYTIDHQTQDIRNFGIQDGLSAKEFNSDAYHSLDNNMFAYGSINGLSIFDPLTLKDSHTDSALTVHATNVHILSRDLSLPSKLNSGDTVHLQHDDVGIRVNFSPLTYSKRHILFEYQLSGVDNVAYPITTENYITFPSLPSGEHSLEVRVKYAGTKNYSERLIINFVVDYAPWSSPLAYLIYSAAFLTLLILWYAKRRQNTRLLLAAHEEVKYRENRLQLALTGSNSEVWDWQSSNNLMFAKRASDELGYSDYKYSYSFEKHLALIHNDEREMFHSRWLKFLELADLSGSFSCSYRMKKANGQWLWFKDLGKIVATDVKGKPSRITGAYTNITQSIVDAERAKFYGEAFKKTKDWVVIISDNFSRVIANESVRKVFSWQEEEFAFDAGLFGLSEQRFNFYLKLFAHLKAGEDWRGEELIKNNEGQEFHVILTVNANINEATGSIYYVCIFTDISAQKHAEKELIYLANYDHLTGLPNRSLLLDRIQHAMDYSARMSQPIALFFIDLDRFKQVNDSLGHDCGDLLLQEISQRLTNILRVDDTIARIGGDEFVVLLESFRGNSQLGNIAQKIISSVGEPVELNGNIVSIGASIGIALYPEDAKDSDELLRNSDVAMYHSKQLGRNIFQFFTPRMNAEASQRLAAESALKLAHENDEFINHYQPIVDSYQGKAIGAELLLRWQSEDGLIPPNNFIPLAEDLGLIISMTEDAILRGVIALKSWREIRPNMYLSINLSAQHFLKDDLITYLKNILHIHKLPAEALKFEVTESMLISDPEKAISTMQALDKLGVVLALDDFGTGYSSLSYLKKLPLKILKIDRSFISGIGRNTADEAIVEAILALASSLKMICIAEGVENKAQLKFLGNKHCHLIQGFLYSKPVESCKILEYLQADTIEIQTNKPE